VFTAENNKKMSLEGSLNIRRVSKRKEPNLPFLEVKNKILGKDYDLSLVFATKNIVLDLNKKYRNKDYVPNILSFNLSEKSGEIYIHLATARIQSMRDFEMEEGKYVLFLFIHGCLHLKGLDHGTKMDQKEKLYLELFYK
jgi:probable rRNA maturation factor